MTTLRYSIRFPTTLNPSRVRNSTDGKTFIFATAMNVYALDVSCYCAQAVTAQAQGK